MNCSKEKEYLRFLAVGASLVFSIDKASLLSRKIKRTIELPISLKGQSIAQVDKLTITVKLETMPHLFASFAISFCSCLEHAGVVSLAL